jgi:hypothetical protein
VSQALAAALAFSACGRLGFEAGPPVLVAGPMAFVQTAQQLIIPASVGAHHLLVLAIDHDQDIAVTSIDDAAGNQYSPAGGRAIATGHDGNVFATELWFAADTLAFDGNIDIALESSDATFVWVAEFDGIATSSPLAAVSTQSNDAVASSGGVVTTAPITTTEPDELVFVLNANNGGVGAIANGNPFVALPIFAGDDTAYTIASEPGAYAAVWTNPMSSVTSYCASVAAFYAAL